MIRPAFLMIAAMSLPAACAGGAAAAVPAARFPASGPVAEGAVPAKAEPLRRPSRPASDAAAPPLASVRSANRSAVREPARDDYVGGMQVYSWAEGSLYRLYAAPGRVSDILLQPGEALVSVAAGDTARWVIGDTSSGSGAARRVHILVKPSAAGLRTNLVIATDRRTYHVDAVSSAAAAMAGIAWAYAEDPLIALEGRTAAEAQQPAVSGVAIEALDFNYRIEGDSPPWRPLRAFDDGRQLFIEFPPALPRGEAPPLFVTGENGRAELVNYRLRGHYYVVDRLFGAAELRLGEKRQQVVRIIRVGEMGVRARSGS